MILRYIVVVAFIMHGLGHISGFIAAFTSRDTGFSSRPWLLSPGVTLRSPTGKGFGVLWLAAMALLVASGVALLVRPEWWPTLPVIGSLVSLVVIAPWWNTVVPGAKVGAAFDALALIALLPPWREQVMVLLGL